MPLASTLDTPVLPRRPSLPSSDNNYSTYKRFERFSASRVVGEMKVEQWFVFLQTAKQKHDYVNGKVVLVPGGSFEHNNIGLDTASAFNYLFAQAGIKCQACGSDQAVYVNDQLYYYPDVTLICGSPQIDFAEAVRNPIAIFEVLSPSTENDDRTDKFRDYQTIDSLRHYVLVEQKRPFVTHYAKQENGLWAVVAMPVNLDEVLTLDLNGQSVSIALSQIYQRASFPGLSEAEAGGPSEEN